tara:strand:- start:461 stop:694 length:234 start_codon:yes stop_codon:yes gene_type:complete
MPNLIKKILFTLIFNTSLLTVLFLGIQNSSNKNKVDFFFDKTVLLPVSFIVGVSFISGSILGSFFNITDVLKNKELK